MSVFDNFGEAEVSVDGNVEPVAEDNQPDEAGEDSDTGAETVTVVLRRALEYTSSSGTEYKRHAPKEVSESEADEVLELENHQGRPLFTRL